MKKSWGISVRQTFLHILDEYESCITLFFGKELYIMDNEKIYRIEYGKVYPLLVDKVVRKGRTAEEVD